MEDDAMPPETPKGPAEEEMPEVYAVKRVKDGFILSRRSFLGAVAVAAAAAGSVRGCRIIRSRRADQPFLQCGDISAHEGPVNGLLTIDETLFSWSEHELKLWRLADGYLFKKIKKDNADYFDVTKDIDLFPVLLGDVDLNVGLHAFAADGKTRASLSPDTNAIEIWSAESGKPDLIQTLTDSEAISVIALSADGKTVFVVKKTGLVEIRNVGDDEPRQTFDTEAAIESSAFPPGGEFLVCATSVGTLLVLSLADGQVVKTIKLGEGVSASMLAATPSGDLAVAESGGELLLVGLPEGQVANKISLDQEFFQAARVSSDGQRVAVGPNLGNIYLLDLKNAALIGCLYDKDLVETRTAVSLGSYMAMTTASCDDPLPSDVTCLCDCVAAARTYETIKPVCVCDNISRPANYTGDNYVCWCHNILVGTKRAPANQVRPSSSGGCASNVPNSGRNSGSHYWRPN